VLWRKGYTDSCFVFGCWWYRLTRAGSVILALHDASDVFLEIGKMSKYCGAESLASISFVLFALSWVVLRLIYYPFWILWSTRFV
jgi:ceramide synthetase